jgi:hypothetical protein
MRNGEGLCDVTRDAAGRAGIEEWWKTWGNRRNMRKREERGLQEKHEAEETGLQEKHETEETGLQEKHESEETGLQEKHEREETGL